MDAIQGKHFSITDPEGVKTVIYQINKTEKEYLKDSPSLTAERLEYTEELVGNNNSKKTFYIENADTNKDKILILSFAKDRVVINNGIIDTDEVKISKKPLPFRFDTIYTEEDQEYREVNYTPDLKRPISIIDPETAEEVRPTLYFDENTNEVRGKCKLKAHKSYFVFEIREENGKVKVVGGAPKVKE